MSTNFDSASPQKLEKNGLDKKQGATYTIQNDKRGHAYHHPQQGRVKVIALFCDCGRSVLVKPSEAKSTSIMCNLCNSPFRWQQLTFNTD